MRAPRRPSPRQRAGRVEGAEGALGAAESGRAADGLATHGEGEGAVKQRGAPGASAADAGMA